MYKTMYSMALSGRNQWLPFPVQQYRSLNILHTLKIILAGRDFLSGSVGRCAHAISVHKYTKMECACMHASKYRRLQYISYLLLPSNLTQLYRLCVFLESKFMITVTIIHKHTTQESITKAFTPVVSKFKVKLICW